MNALQRKKRPQWSLAVSFWLSLATLMAVTAIVLAVVEQSIWKELEVVTVIMALIMWIYFSILLYVGVRFNAREKAVMNWPVGEPSDYWDASSYAPQSGFFTELGAEGGVIGVIIGFLLDVLVAILLMFVVAWFFWLGVNVIIVLCIPFFWFHRRSLRYLITRGRRYRGQWGASIFHGFATALLYSIWFYLIFFAAHQIFQSLEKTEGQSSNDWKNQPAVLVNSRS